MNTTKKPPWTFWGKLLMLSVAVTGHEAIYTAEVSYGIPTLLRTGLKAKYASTVWVFSPLLGILFQGYLGSASDRCLCPWGRRRPFILVLTVCVAVSTILFSFGGILSEALGLSGVSFAFLYTLITFGVMDFCMDQFEPPVRMYLLDSVPLEHSDRANYIYTAMTSVGALCGALIGAVRWSQNIKYQVCIVFGLTLCLFVLCVAMALCSFKEEHPITLRDRKRKLRTSECDDCPSVDTCISISDNAVIRTKSEVPSPSGLYSSYVCSHCITPISTITFISLFESVAFNIVDSVRGTVEFVMCMSQATLVLWAMVFLDWIAYINFNIFFSDYVGVVVYGGSTNSQEDPNKLLLYDQGVRSSCWCRVAMEMVSFCYLLLLDLISDRVNKKWILAAGHVFNLVAVALLLVVPNLYLAGLMSISCAILCTNLHSMTFSLIHHYEVCVILIHSTVACMASYGNLVAKVITL